VVGPLGPMFFEKWLCSADLQVGRRGADLKVSATCPPVIPKLETKQGPEYFPVVSPHAPMFCEKPAHKRDIEHPLAF
jgi:hypothetical protein